MCIIGIIFRFL